LVLIAEVCEHSFCASYVFVVAVKSLKQVKITDFGLAKVLEHDQHQVYGSGGKVWFSSLLFTTLY